MATVIWLITNSKCQQTLIKERLPRRAKLLFVAEDYNGKKEVIEEVMQHWVKDKYSNVA